MANLTDTMKLDLPSFYRGAFDALRINPGRWAVDQLLLRTKSDEDAHGAVAAMAGAASGSRVEAGLDWLSVKPGFRKVVE